MLVGPTGSNPTNLLDLWITICPLCNFGGKDFICNLLLKQSLGGGCDWCIGVSNLEGIRWIVGEVQVEGGKPGGIGATVCGGGIGREGGKLGWFWFVLTRVKARVDWAYVFWAWEVDHKKGWAGSLV